MRSASRRADRAGGLDGILGRAGSRPDRAPGLAHASGWIAEFAPADTAEPLRVVIDGFPAVPVQPSVARPDVQAFLGDEGVAGFQADMGDLLGYAVPEGSVIRLCRGERTLHEVTLVASPIGDGAGSCVISTANRDETTDPRPDHRTPPPLPRARPSPHHGPARLAPPARGHRHPGPHGTDPAVGRVSRGAAVLAEDVIAASSRCAPCRGFVCPCSTRCRSELYRATTTDRPPRCPHASAPGARASSASAGRRSRRHQPQTRAAEH